MASGDRADGETALKGATVRVRDEAVGPGEAARERQV